MNLPSYFTRLCNLAIEAQGILYCKIEREIYPKSLGIAKRLRVISQVGDNDNKMCDDLPIHNTITKHDGC